MAEKTKWTQGPWVELGGDVWADGSLVAGVPGDNPNARANAHLIVAAPELYDALEWCVRIMRGHMEGLALHPEWTLAHSALAKARGE